MTMKKLTILIAAVAMMAMTACNEKPAKGAAESNESKAPAATEQAAPKVSVEKAAPTQDGKDHTVAEFKTQDYQVKLENLADGSYRLTLAGKDNKVIETKKCVFQGGNYLMKDDNGQNYIINSTPGSEEITIMNSKEIVYHGTNGK